MENQTEMEEQETAPSYYQTAVLTPELVNTLVRDDSPPILSENFWTFLGVDIPVSVILSFDFKNILDMVDLEFINMLEEYPEDEWENVAIVEYQERIITTEDGEKIKKMIPVKAYNLIETWQKMHDKTYLKMCRAREGFTLKRLTENRSIIEQDIKQRVPIGIGGQMQTKESRWKWW